MQTILTRLFKLFIRFFDNTEGFILFERFCPALEELHYATPYFVVRSLVVRSCLSDVRSAPVLHTHPILDDTAQRLRKSSTGYLPVQVDTAVIDQSV